MTGERVDPLVPLDPDRLDAIEQEACALRWSPTLGEVMALVAAARETIALRADLAAAEADAALCRERLGDERERRRQAEAEVERLRDVVRVSEPQVMHPHMGGDHQVHYRGSTKNLTPEQWATIARAEKGDDDGE